MNKNKLSVYLPLILAGVLLLGIILGIQLGHVDNGFSLFKLKKSENKLNEVINYVNQNYVDSVSKPELVDKSIKGLLNSLDPHSTFISASEFHDANDPLLGSFEGIGVQFRLENDSITVVLPVAGGPSEKLGIRAGDRIVTIDGKKVAGVKISDKDVMRKLKGKKGTKVEVGIFRRGVHGLIKYTVIRDLIPTYSLDVSYMVKPGIGFIRLNNFSATTHDEVHDALQKLNARGMKKLILDLTGNGGGYLQAAIDVADEFLPAGKLIVYTQGVNHPKEVANATGNGLFEMGELVVMIDEFSASASEIVAGAIQDNDRGEIIGRRSFGKGLVQEQMNFKDGSAIRLTVAKYYTPTGRCIQRPYKNGTEDYYNQYYHRILDTQEGNPDSIHFPDSLKFKTPKGKIVYGGGGIQPDIWVPVEKDPRLKFYNMVANKGTINQFAFEFTDRNRQKLNRFKTYEQFDKGFNLTGEDYAEFLKYAEKNGIKREAGDQSVSDARIKIMLKAFIGRNILDNIAFYPYLNSIDPTFIRSMEYLEKGK